MFENAGKKVKDIAIVCFYIELIIFAIVAWKIGENGAAEFNFWGFVFILAIGFVVSYLSVIMMVAFGELVENSSTIVKYLEKTTLKDAKNKEEESIFKDTEKPIVNTISGSNTVGKTTTMTGFWVCSKCGRQNHNTVGTCGCGQDKNA